MSIGLLVASGICALIACGLLVNGVVLPRQVNKRLYYYHSATELLVVAGVLNYY